MAVKVGNLWKDTKFQSLDDRAKLFYLYLASQPSITTLGVVVLNMFIVGIELSMDIDTLRKVAIVLRDKGYVAIHNTDEGVYFVVLDHFMTLPKSELTVKKAKAEMSTLPKKLSESLSDKIDISKKFLTFTEPTEQEVLDYAISKGFVINAKEFIGYYRDIAERLGKSNGWYDKYGKQVKNWQGKLTKVWFKDENKLKECKDAPEGFKFFHANVNGRIVYPDYWKEGKPISKEGMIVNKKLQEEYARQTSSV